MAKGVKVRNTTVNGGMTGRDREINKVFAFKDGNTYSSMKRYAKASNPNSALQALTRSIFTSTSAGWSALTDDQRKAWNSEAPRWVNTGIFGDKKQSGKNLYTGCNIALACSHGTLIDVPNRKEFMAVANSVELVYGGGALEFIADFDPYFADDRIQLKVSPQLSEGTSKNSKYVSLFVASCDVAVHTDVTATYVAKYGAIVPGKKIFYEVRQISEGGNTITLQKGVVTLV